MDARLDHGAIAVRYPLYFVLTYGHRARRHMPPPCGAARERLGARMDSRSAVIVRAGDRCGEP